MIRHYFDFAARVIQKHRGYALIHLIGLACGFAAALLIFLFVQHELSFDRFHSKADRIARMIAYRTYGDGMYYPLPHMPLPLGPALAEEVSSVRDYVRIGEATDVHIMVGDAQFDEDITLADASLFSLFDFPLVRGTANGLFKSPDEVVVTEKVAVSHFGTTDIVGRTMEMFLYGDKRSFTVVGVAKDIPAQSTIQFGVVIPITELFRYEEASARWGWWRVNTYVEFDRPVTQVDTTVIAGLVSRRWADRSNPAPIPLQLQPLVSVHLAPQTGGSNPMYSYILAGIALVILFIAGVNYVSLGVARGVVRVREVAIRKLFGAVRRQVMGQLLAESVLLAAAAVIVAFVLAELALPSFSSFVGRPLAFNFASNYLVSLFGVLMALVVGVGAGIVPAVLLSRPQPAEMFRTAHRLARSGYVMRAMIIIQFALSTFLIIGTIVMFNQNSHVAKQPLGFSAESVLVVKRPPNNSINDLDFLQRFKNEMAGNSLVKSVAATSTSFNRGYDAYGWNAEGKHITTYIYRVDPGYISTLQLKLVAGRDFAVNPGEDVANPIIVNESFLKELGEGYTVGSQIPALDTMFGEIGAPTIVGVVADYHYQSLHEQIGPVLLFTRELYPYFQLLVRIDNRDIPAATAAVERAYHKVSSGLQCQWSFLDDDIGMQYANEQRWFKIVSTSAIFAISIAALGMFGLAGITAVRRSRDVGIRRVLGATVSQVLRVMNREYLIIVLVANVIAWPLAWYASEKWLDNFAYRIDLSLWSFVVAGLVACAVAMLAVSAHTIKTALMNPSNVLRHE